MEQSPVPGGAEGAGPGVWAYRRLTRPVRNTLTRYRVVRRLSAIFDLTLGPLALVTLVLLVAELLLQLSSPWNTIVYVGQLATWAIFLLAFAVELSLAPKKVQYVRRNWLLVIALIVPALRVLRAAQALRFLRTARVARGASVVRSFTSLNRAMTVIREFLGFSQVAYLAALTAVVWLAVSGLVYYLESSTDSAIDTVGDALWWAAAVLTTVGISAEPETPEGRIVAVALRVFGVAIIGYLTARLAAFFLGGQSEERRVSADEEIKALRRDIAALREELSSEKASEPKRVDQGGTSGPREGVDV